MARTLQKKIVFSRGEISPALVERADLELYDKSAQVLENFISTIYGGIRSRRGTMLVDTMQSGITGTAISYAGGNADYIQTAGYIYETATLNNRRNIISIDYGEILTPSGYSFYLGNLKSEQIVVAEYYTSVGSHIFNNPQENAMRIQVHGGGGGSSTWAGGAGAYLDVKTTLPSGQINTVTGNYGSGAAAYSRNNNGSNGGESSVSFDSGSIICAGGQGAIGLRNGDETGQGSTYSYAPQYSFSNDYEVLNASTNTQRRESWFDDGSRWGGGGEAAASTTSAGNAGTRGNVIISLVSMPAVIESSVDGETWTTEQTFNIDEKAQNIQVTITHNFRYIRLRITAHENYTLSTRLSLDLARLSVYDGSDKSVKLIPFIYNNADKYVLALADGIIYTYHNGEYEEIINAPALSKRIMKEIKYTSKDDTIIFTHQEIPPQILKRTDNGWVFSELDIENPPYMLFGEENKENKNIGIKPSAAEGAVKITADSGVFTADSVGQYIDGGGGRVKITSYESATVVSGNTVIPFYNDEKINEWTYISGYEKAWSVTRGYPRTCLFAQQRLWFGGSRDKPASVWASRVGDYFNFQNRGNYDNDGINIDLTTNGVIVNMLENRGIHIFTSDEEISIPENSLTPDSIRATVNTQNGSLATLQPLVFDGLAVFMEKNSKSLLSYVYNDEQASYVTDNISLLSNLLDEPVAMDVEINSAKDKGNFLYVVLEKGLMLVWCLVQGQNINSVCRFVTDGKIVDVCCVGADTYILVNRNNVLYLEKIEDVLTDFTQVKEISGNTITLEAYYGGKRVWFYNDKAAEVHTVPFNGEVTLNQSYYGKMYVGLGYVFDLQSNPIAINGRTFDLKKRIAKAMVVCQNTPVLYFCEQCKYNEDVYEFYGCSPYGNDVRFNIKGEFYPINILSVTLNINYEG